ncbi:putative signal peptide protein [Puccinia sorghi]|uniref:Putative signal peptide protein n=1 Tax=Puccinia sorghi TaxID=27349 RepID=A0A0L6UTS9_9BASI|nr:putative signal peptide protein [Puccinia sorghi]
MIFSCFFSAPSSLFDVLTTLGSSTSTTYCSLNIKSIIVLKVLQPDTSHGKLAWLCPSQACDQLTPTWACVNSGLGCAQRGLAIGQAHFRVGQERLTKNHPNLMECPVALDTQHM